MIAFASPKTLDEAERRRLEAVGRVQEIQQQLGDRNRPDPQTGERMGDVAYWQWRRRATYALKCANAELRSLNAWIKSANTAAVRSAADRVVDVNDALSALSASYRLLRKIAAEVEVTDEEQLIIDSLWEAIRIETAKRQSAAQR